MKRLLPRTRNAKSSDAIRVFSVRGNSVGGRESPSAHTFHATSNKRGYASWSKVIDYLCWLGGHFTDAPAKRQLITAAMEAIGGHERALSNRLLHGSNGLGGLLGIPSVTVYGEVEDLSEKEPAFAFQVENLSSKEVVARFAEKHISIFNRVSDAYSRHTLKELGIGECVRVSLCHYNTPHEVDAFLTVLEEIAS